MLDEVFEDEDLGIEDENLDRNPLSSQEDVLNLGEKSEKLNHKNTILSPLQLHLKKICDENLIAEGEFLEKLKKMISQTNLTMKNAEEFNHELEQELIKIRSDYTELEEIYGIVDRANERIKYLKDFRLYSEEALEQNFEHEQLDYSTFLDSKILHYVDGIFKLLVAMLDEKYEFNLADDAKEYLIFIRNNVGDFNKKVVAVKNQIKELEKNEHQLKIDIEKFSQIVESTKKMNKVTYDQYFEELSKLKADLESKRSIFLEEETLLNEYIDILYDSIVILVDSFDELSKFVLGTIDENIKALMDKNEVILSNHGNLQHIELLREDLTQMTIFKDKIQDCINLNKKYS